MVKDFRYFIAVPITDLDAKHIGYHLKRLREFLGEKQRKIIENTSHCPSTISKMEKRGVNPQFNTIQSYIKALGAEFYAFVPANLFAAEFVSKHPEFIVVQITPEELRKIKEQA